MAQTGRAGRESCLSNRLTLRGLELVGPCHSQSKACAAIIVMLPWKVRRALPNVCRSFGSEVVPRVALADSADQVVPRAGVDGVQRGAALEDGPERPAAKLGARVRLPDAGRDDPEGH